MARYQHLTLLKHRYQKSPESLVEFGCEDQKVKPLNAVDEAIGTSFQPLSGTSVEPARVRSFLFSKRAALRSSDVPGIHFYSERARF
jgi:hypothetical protein